MNPEPDEYRLALRARNGDREALEELVRQTRFRLFALAYSELRHYDDAQDAVASALVRICLHIKELREPEHIHGWMNSIVRNECHRLRKVPVMMNLEEADGSTEDNRYSLLRLDIECALRRLPFKQARVIQLFYLEGMPISEIAQAMGCPEGTVKSWLHRGRQHLAKEMEE